MDCWWIGRWFCGASEGAPQARIAAEELDDIAAARAYVLREPLNVTLRESANPARGCTQGAGSAIMDRFYCCAAGQERAGQRV